MPTEIARDELGDDATTFAILPQFLALQELA
jgi:hypothetical protein